MVRLQAFGRGNGGDTSNAVTEEQQEAIMRVALPLFEDESVQVNALYLIENAAFPTRVEQKYRQNFSMLPDLKKLFQRNSSGHFGKQLERVIKRMDNG